MDGEQNNGSLKDLNRENGGPSGPVIGIVVILVLVILGGLYFWSQRAKREIPTSDQTVESIQTQGQTDTTTSIEEDLNQTDIENLDASLDGS